MGGNAAARLTTSSCIITGVDTTDTRAGAGQGRAGQGMACPLALALVARREGWTGEGKREFGDFAGYTVWSEAQRDNDGLSEHVAIKFGAQWHVRNSIPFSH